MIPTRIGQQQGQVSLVVALCLALLVGSVGLAVDSGLGYLIKAKLNAAVDSAALAAARAASMGRNQAEQRANAAMAARDFFDANFPPSGFVGSNASINQVMIAFDQPTPGSITAEVAATARFAVTFSSVFGFNLMDVTATAVAVRKDLDMAFVVDTSGSLQNDAPKVRSSASAFLDRFSVTTDRVSLLHFATGAVVDQPFRPGASRGFDRDLLKVRIRDFDFNGFTNSSEAIWNARDQLNRIALRNRSTLRVIVFFSDGAPNSFASRFQFRFPSVCQSVGVIAANDNRDGGTPSGLWAHDRQHQEASGSCYQNQSIADALSNRGLPDWYNAHGSMGRDFPVVTSGPRVVNGSTYNDEITYLNVNRAAKNLLESMAAKARSEGIYIFSLGLGALLKRPNEPGAPASDTGENLLKCIANTKDAPERCRTAGAGQPEGVYCHAETADQLQPCFSLLASEILRIAK